MSNVGIKILVKPFYCLLIYSFINLSSYAYASNYDQHTIIIKFKSSSELFTLIRRAVPSSWSGSLTNEDHTYTQPKIEKFFKDFGIQSIFAIKPDADEKPLAGGVERIFILKLYDTNSCAVASSLMKTKGFEYTENDYFAFPDDVQKELGSPHSKFISDPNDIFFSEQWGLRNTGQFMDGSLGIPGADINILPAWQITTGNPETIIAVLDSGIPLDNPEFNGRILQGYDFVNNDNSPQDDYGHGTAVAGVIAATGNNNFDISGVNWKCRILPLKISNSKGESSFSNWCRGFIYATDNGANVINLSYSSNGDSSHAVLDAILYSYNRGSIIVTSMGNNSGNVYVIPAVYGNVIAVGAINNRNQRTSFSNFGSFIDFMAPGTSIYSIDFFYPGIRDCYGTSMSAGFVSGVISLMIGMKKDLNFQDIYGLLKKGAKDKIGNPNEDTPGWDQYYGWGCIDAGKTLTYLMDTNIIHTVPNNYYINQNYPNPFNLSTTIEFGIPNDGYVNLAVFDIVGKKIMTLVDQNKKAGKYIVYWDAYDWASDIYFYVFKTSNGLFVKKMILIK